jgi:succinate dehydrogenase / fumarate reductase, cytochrome b subunit
MLYRWRTGANAWLIHRISGVVVGLYLLLHILDRFGAKYDLKGLAGLGDFLTSKAMAVIILALLIYHSLNGVRELIIDFGSGALYYKKLYWVMMLIGVVVYVAALTAL